jgi:hypothetical protein
MCESLFFSQRIESFLAAHPQHEGWKVYEYPEDLFDKLCLASLLDCLRDLHPEALRQRVVLTEPAEHDLLGTAGKARAIEPGSEWDLLHEFNSCGWIGSVEIEWNGQPIHYFASRLFIGAGFGNLYFVATKSNLALRDFQRMVTEYGHARR